MKLNTLPLSFPERVGLDIETTSLDRFACTLRTVAISDGSETWILTDHFERITPLLEDPTVTKIIHNADYDLPVLVRYLDCSPQNIYDTLLVERILNAGLMIDNSLEQVLARRLGILIDKSLSTSFTDGLFAQVISEEQLQYIENDCKHLIRLSEEQAKEIGACNLWDVVNLENADILVTLDKTMTGVGFDLQKWGQMRAEIEMALAYLQDEMLQTVGEDFSIRVRRKQKEVLFDDVIEGPEIKWNSPEQLKAALHAIGLKVRDTKRLTLEQLEDRHPLIPLLLEWKKWFKALTWRWEEYINETTGRIHPGWNQMGTITGRFSSSNPNMQQIPRTMPGYPNFRALFRSLPNHKLVICDWSQQEPRILAHVSQDTRMIEAANESDIYLAFAKDIWDEEIERHDLRRQLAKIAVLATFYGVWYGNLAPRLGTSEQDTKDLQEKIFRAYPRAKQWGDYQFEAVLSHGYTQTVLGRRIYFADLRKSLHWKIRKDSRNYPIQGTGADMAKLAEIKIYDIIQTHKFDAHLMIGLHDELVVTCHQDQAEEFFPLMQQAMESAGKTLCPSVNFPVEGVISDTWEH